MNTPARYRILQGESDVLGGAVGADNALLMLLNPLPGYKHHTKLAPGETTKAEDRQHKRYTIFREEQPATIVPLASFELDERFVHIPGLGILDATDPRAVAYLATKGNKP